VAIYKIGKKGKFLPKLYFYYELGYFSEISLFMELILVYFYYRLEWSWRWFFEGGLQWTWNDLKGQMGIAWEKLGKNLGKTWEKLGTFRFDS
jgi:hypothetical protein